MSNTHVTQESASNDRRLLHFTLKLTDRLIVKNFFCGILGMKMLRHEEMESGCVAQCNGNFESPWSKTMVGYGDENSFFALELNYNYEVQGYTYGDDFASVTIRSRQAVANARQNLDKAFIDRDDGDQQSMVIRSPDGHHFILIDDDVPTGNDPVQCLSLNVSNLKKSVDYYSRLLKMTVNEEESNDNRAKLYYGSRTESANQESKLRSKSGFLVEQQCQLELIGVNHPIRRGTGYGRKAISCPTDDVEGVQKLIEQNGCRILIPSMRFGGMLDLNTDKVVILSDPDGNEVR
jgi:catechol 2,3-dioxygenase-like lactoylglutathione lyase family enzyme